MKKKILFIMVGTMAALSFAARTPKVKQEIEIVKLGKFDPVELSGSEKFLLMSLRQKIFPLCFSQRTERQELSIKICRTRSVFFWTKMRAKLLSLLTMLI